MQEEGDYDFHYQIIKGSGNMMLSHLLCDEMYHLIRMFRTQTSRIPRRSDNALIEHEQLIYAIEQRNSQMAEMTMRHHIHRAKESIRQYMSD
jgi:DNA-binding GntR family transcriptional regulator